MNSTSPIIVWEITEYVNLISATLRTPCIGFIKNSTGSELSIEVYGAFGQAYYGYFQSELYFFTLYYVFRDDGQEHNSLYEVYLDNFFTSTN